MYKVRLQYYIASLACTTRTREHRFPNMGFESKKISQTCPHRFEKVYVGSIGLAGMGSPFVFGPARTSDSFPQRTCD